MIRLRPIVVYLTLALNILLIFLSIFEDRVQLPVFLQVTGRMHPAVVHFPLVLVFVVIFLEWITTRKESQPPVAKEIINYVLYFFALSSAASALFGFFLLREGAYNGDTVALHRWMGTAVSLLSAIILAFKEKSSRRYYYGALIVTTVLLTITGHVGSEVTHGEGFLTEPIRRQQKGITIEHPDSAIVFRDVIQPILNEKCVNCHNPNRAKNDLILTEYNSILNGGEHPGAVIAGAAEKSLVYKHITLPMADTLHMPPEGKQQLDREEIRLIGWWINTGASEDEKYLHMSKVDSIHSIMLSKFQPKQGLDLVKIPFADPNKIAALSNPYRTVSQISAVKPYVAVFLGSKKDFNANDIKELNGLSRQIVSIDLGNSSVSNADLKTLADFPHLQKLHLQNLPISDEGLKPLGNLRYLDVLNLSGTDITGNALNEISGWKNLKKLYIYNTPVDDTSVESLRQANPQLEVFNTQLDLTDTLYDAKLRRPIVKVDSLFFRDQATVDVRPSRGKVKYHYTLDGTSPATNAPLYTAPLQIKQTGTVKVIAVMEGWENSDVATYKLIRVGLIPDRIHLTTKADPKLSAKSDSVLVDHKPGSLDRGDKAYLAFVNTDLDVVFETKETVRASEITVSFLQDVNNAVLPPGYAEVWGGMEKGNLVNLGKVSTPHTETKSAEKGLITITFAPREVRYIRLRAKNVGRLPSDHPLAKTAKATLYIDEVSLN
jgi:uncharacterized membrane protein